MLASVDITECYWCFYRFYNQLKYFAVPFCRFWSVSFVKQPLLSLLLELVSPLSSQKVQQQDNPVKGLDHAKSFLCLASAGGGRVFLYIFISFLCFNRLFSKTWEKIKRLHLVSRISVIISSKLIIRLWFFSKETSKSKFYHVHVLINW